MADASQTLYDHCIAEFGPALIRLASAYESDFDLRHDLLQEIHVALWRSLATFDKRCSLRTWAFRVAHNTAASHVGRAMRGKHNWVSLVLSSNSPLTTDGTTGKRLQAHESDSESLPT